MSKDTPNKVGRPSKYTPELAEAICEQVAEGCRIEDVCRENGISRSTFYRWADTQDGFWDKATRAREISAFVWEDHQIECAEALKDAKTMVDVHAARERASIYREIQKLRAPRTHGDLTKLEHTGSGGTPLVVQINRPGGDGAIPETH